MAFSAKHIPVVKTNYFSSIVEDYLSGDPALRPFYEHLPGLEGISAAIKQREGFSFDRELLTSELKKQYSGIEIHPAVERHLLLLAQENTFTVCTAHQPNIFTGHLYFVYKIIHAIKLARHLADSFPDKNFIPVFYMGSEDADLEELGNVEIAGVKYQWNTDQKGAVGRMQVDKGLLEILEAMSGQLLVLPFGSEIIEILKTSYQPGRTIESATFQLLNSLFGRFGLVVLLTDNKEFKSSFKEIFEKELNEGFSSKAVASAIEKLPVKYKVQAGGRDLNLFYLQDQSRERIEKEGSGFKINNTGLVFSHEEMSAQLSSHPECFSPNVILRPVYQEWLLPNIAFIGGGGELAYWLELKAVFSAAGIPMPVLVLRNSFLLIQKRWAEKISKWALHEEELFGSVGELINRILIRSSANKLDLDEEKAAIEKIFNSVSQKANLQDRSLDKHVISLQQRLMDKLTGVEKKMMRAARKREQDLVRQVNSLHSALFPNGQLQERVENIIPLYARFGPGFLDVLLLHSGNFDQEFTIITEE